MLTSITVSPGGSYVISAGLVCYTTMTVVGERSIFPADRFSGFPGMVLNKFQRYPVDTNVSTGTLGTFSASSFQLIWYIYVSASTPYTATSANEYIV